MQQETKQEVNRMQLVEQLETGSSGSDRTAQGANPNRRASRRFAQHGHRLCWSGGWKSSEKSSVLCGQCAQGLFESRRGRWDRRREQPNSCLISPHEIREERMQANEAISKKRRRSSMRPASSIWTFFWHILRS